MAKVVDIERVRVERLADELLPAIREAFAGPGLYKVSTAGIEDVERWRRAARACARRLGARVRTVVSADGAWVWVVDESPLTVVERAQSERLLRDVLS